MAAKKIALELEPHVFDVLKSKAREQHRSIENYIKGLLEKDTVKIPNAETRKALKEANEGRNLGEIEDFAAFIESL